MREDCGFGRDSGAAYLDEFHNHVMVEGILIVRLF